MTISLEGASAKVHAHAVFMSVPDNHPLIKLANALPWLNLLELCAEDLKRTTAGGFWWTGRKIQVRIQLAAYLLQKLYNLTDRAAGHGIKDIAAYRLFCGVGIIDKWHAPDVEINKHRQRLLVSRKFEGIRHARCRGDWPATAIEYQENKIAAAKRASRKTQGPPSRYRATHRSCKTGRRPS